MTNSLATLKGVLIICGLFFSTDGLSASEMHWKDTSKKHHEKRIDSIIGAHGFNFTLFTNIPELTTDAFGVVTYHADGTFAFHGSEFLTQSIGGNQGALNTVLMGNWKKIDKNTFKATGEFVQLLRNPLDPALPAIPSLRWKVKIIQVMDRDGVTGSFSGVATPHPVDDLELDQPAPPPFTGLVLEASGVTRKVPK